MEKIPAPRGNITDRHGRLMATSEARFNLSISPFRANADQITSTLQTVKALYPEATIPPVEEVMKVRPRWEGILLAETLTMAEATPLLERQVMLPGLRLEQTFLRVYPLGRTVSIITGYVGHITRSVLERYLNQGYDYGDIVGKAALEKRYEEELRGKKGRQIVHRDARGLLIKSRLKESASPGARLVTTVDLELQQFATQKMMGREGVILVMDPRNGEILTMVSAPNYDANFPERMSVGGNSGWNKVLREHFAPGSAFKLVTGAAWLLYNQGNPGREIFCGGYIQLGKRRMHCDARHGHGYLNLRHAIERSCNIYFYTLARETGLEKMSRMASLFGFGRPTGVSLYRSGESAGILGQGTAPNPGNLVMMGIGQGRYISVTPIQLLRAYCALANGGKVYRPMVIRSIEYPDGRIERLHPEVVSEIPWTEAQRDALMVGFRDVCETAWGTGRHANFDPQMKVAGKTSTAERGGEADAGFVCFSPWDQPEVAVYVLLEGAGHGGEMAAPVAREILERYYALQKQRLSHF